SRRSEAWNRRPSTKSWSSFSTFSIGRNSNTRAYADSRLCARLIRRPWFAAESNACIWPGDAVQLERELRHAGRAHQAVGAPEGALRCVTGPRCLRVHSSHMHWWTGTLALGGREEGLRH